MGTETGTSSDGRRPPRTTCKICWCSVFAEDDVEWVIAPSPGIAHKICAVERRLPPPSS